MVAEFVRFRASLLRFDLGGISTYKRKARWCIITHGMRLACAVHRVFVVRFFEVQYLFTSANRRAYSWLKIGSGLEQAK